MEITITVNGTTHALNVPPNWSLADVLRERLGLIGVKLGCESGHCGACTVLLNGQAVNSCLVIGVEANGQSVETVEGQMKDGELSELQKAFVEHHAIQCGFCTPGLIMSATALLSDNPNPSEQEVREGLQGNLCRCTGYFKPVQAILSVTKKNK